MNRRQLLRRSSAVGLTVALAGCTYYRNLRDEGAEADGQESETTTTAAETTAAEGETVEVAVGPDGDYLSFVPTNVEISVGDTVRWTARSAGHNVSAKPDASDRVDIPDAAEPFSSYEGGRSYAVLAVGTSYEHTFDVPGEYVYVCVPHAAQGMVGTVTVTE